MPRSILFFIPSKQFFLRLTASGFLIIFALQIFAINTPTSAQRRISFIRDTEIENLVRAYAAPLLSVAGLGRSNIEIVLVQDKSIDAFVADGRHIFINIGTLMQLKTPNEVIGVLAHEIGHLAGNHLIGLRQEIARANKIAAISMLLGAAAIAGGAAAGHGEAASGGIGVMLGGQEVARRTLLSYRRVQESAADRAALTYLRQTKQSAAGMLKVFRRFADQTMFSKRFIDPYAQSHPMPRERINQAERLAKKSPYFNAKDSKRFLHRHAMMRAKLYGFIEGPRAVARRYPKKDQSIVARYARAVSAAVNGSPKQALRQINQLIKSEPNNPYFWELKGQTLFETGKIKNAIPSLKKAVGLAPKAGLIRILYGSALVETGNKSLLKEAVRQLKRGLRQNGEIASAYRYLGQAYQQLGKNGMAQLSAAQEAFIKGDYKTARSFAKRAQAKLKHGTPGWLRADDIVSYKPPQL